MSSSVTAANAIQNLIYRAVAWADMAENDATSPATSIDIALHTAAPVTSSQSSNEVTVGEWNTYVKKSITRNTSEWEAARADTHREALDACYKVIDATK